MNVFSIALTLSFCLLKVTDAVAFKVLPPFHDMQVQIAICKIKMFGMFPIVLVYKPEGDKLVRVFFYFSFFFFFFFCIIIIEE